MVEGKKVAFHTSLVVNIGSVEVYRAATQAGYIDVLVTVGAIIGTLGCGFCGGC